MGNSLELNQRAGSSYNQYFTFTNNSAFYVLSPLYLFNYYNIEVRSWDEWNRGWVENFHSTERGILPTQLGGSICQKVADLIYGAGVMFESTGNKNAVNNSLDFLADIDNKINIKANIKDSILKSVQLGNSYLKINKDINGDLWIDCIAGNRCFVDLDSRGRVVKSRSYINIYTGGVPSKDKKADSYALVEERYYLENENGDFVQYKGSRVPMVKYCVYKIPGVANVWKGDTLPIAFDDLPRPIQREFRSEYAGLMLDEPQLLKGMRNLGVYHIKHTPYVTGLPNVKFGESCLAKILNYLPKYDLIDSEETIDLRLSRPKVLIPDFMSRGKNDNIDQLEQWDDIVFTKIPNKSDKEQVPTVVLTTPRTDYFIKAKEDVIKKICGNLGVATSSLFSDIADARGNVTAREIDSETSNTALYQLNKRDLIIDSLNELVRDVLAFYNKEESVKVSFTPASASNISVMVENAVKLKNANLTSEYQAIKELHPNWSEKQIDEELSEIHKTDASTNENGVAEPDNKEGGEDDIEDEAKDVANEEDNDTE